MATARRTGGCMRGTAAGEAVTSQAATPDYRDNHARIFGERRAQRGVWVMRCERCHGVTLPAGATRYDCGDCGGNDCRGSIDASQAPAPTPEAKSAPFMVDRFMEGSVATDGTDIGSRRKREEYKRRTGVTDASDYGAGHADRVRSAKERAVADST